MSEDSKQGSLPLLWPLNFALGIVIAFPALFLPYRARAKYFSLIAWIVHWPYRIFGRLAGFVMRALNEK